MESVLQVRQLRKVYDGVKAVVDAISFDLKKGEILGFLGPNGSGKTTTIQMLLGTLIPTSGSIQYFGLDFQANRSEILSRVSFASTYTSLPWLLTLRENLSVYGRLYGLNPRESASRFEPLLERFGLTEMLNQRVSMLSAGQTTRLMLVKAFFVQPQVVLLDEPTASLDPEIAHEVCRFLLEQRAQTGISILFTSHKMEEVSVLCDRVIFLKSGKIIADDVPRNLARSSVPHRLHLVISEGEERLEPLLKRMGATYERERAILQISLQEEAIATFLLSLAREGIAYSHIRIEEPSLEHYFLRIARKES